jgi:2-oxoglutarate ferredoxin oxidoreductase subunit beta
MTDTKTTPEVMVLTAKDFASDQDIRWCPGCGDYSILKQVQTVLPTINVPKENITFIAGIGCSSRFPYYMNTYGMHSIHGRATAVATGLKIANPDLSVWVITGDGDGLSIGGNHMIHILRRNVDVNILLFNNEIYGLTKGQYSPTSKPCTVTKSTPQGSVDHAFNPSALALGADASFFARSMDRDPKHLQAMIKRSEAHKGASLLEIYQNCPIFNDGAFFVYTDKGTKEEEAIFLEHGQPLTFGKADNKKGIILDGYKPKVVSLDNVSESDLWIHDEKDFFKAQIISRFFDVPSEEDHLPRPFGVFLDIDRPVYNEQIVNQLNEFTTTKGEGDLDDLIAGNNTWTII